MRLAGCGLLAAAGIWSGLLTARCVSEAASRCGAWCRMLELMSCELESFRTPLPELFSVLAERLEGRPGQLCGSVSAELASGSADLRAVWREQAAGLPAPEREILLPLGDVLGRFGAEDQTAAIRAAGKQMDALWQTRRGELRDRRKVCLGVCSAGGILLAVLLI